MAEADKLIPQVTLDLPTSHFEFDFSSFDQNAKQRSPHKPYQSVFQGYGSGAVKCVTKDCTCEAHSLLARHTEDIAKQHAHPVTRHCFLRWPWKYCHHGRSDTPGSDYSSKSVSSTTYSITSSATNCTTCTTSSTPCSLSPRQEDHPSSSLLCLPPAILNQIIGYAVTVPSIITIGHDSLNVMQVPSHPTHTTLRQSVHHPLFLVSYSIRNRALDVFFSKNIFIIDVAAIYDSSASCIDLQIKLLHKFWITQTPALVQSSLRRVSRLILRLPVPSTEAAVHRGREELNWMDGSDGHGGGGYKMRSLKEEVEDAMIIQKCVQSIASMRVVPAQTGKAISRPSRSLGRPRRSKSLKNMRSTSHRRGEDSITNGIEDIEKRPLRLLEIILVKRSSRALVLREVLGLVHILKDIEVRGTRRVCFELNGKKTVWATKRKETWDDRVSNTEPDGAKLLRDLQHLQTWRPLDIEPITSPTEFKYVSLNEEGRLLISPTALRHATLGFHNAIIPVTPRLRTGLAGQKPRTDSFAFIMEQGIMLLQGVPTPREKGVELECQGDNDEENEVGSRR